MFAAVTSAEAADSGWFFRSASVAGPFSTSVSGSPVPCTGSLEPLSPSSGSGSVTPILTRRSSLSAESSALSESGFSVP